MHYLALATDYDGTLAHHGQVAKTTLDALTRLRASGRILMLVTGRELDDLRRIFPEADQLFSRVIAENGALLYDPSTQRKIQLAPAANQELVEHLKRKKVSPLFVGASIIATEEPHHIEAIKAIQKLGLELQVFFNKGSVMILPSGINKQTGLMAALEDVGLSSHNVIAVGDAENDHALLHAAGCGVAVENALDSLKSEADWVTGRPHGEGVVELIERLLADDLISLDRKCSRQKVAIGRIKRGKEFRILLRDAAMLIAGPSGSGKSTVTMSVLEKVAAAQFQYCVIDPEGDYEHFPGSICLGNPAHVPSSEEVLQLLENFDNPVVNLLGISISDRPRYFNNLLSKIQELRSRTGRPHLIVIDEAHHLLPSEWSLASITLPILLDGTLLVTVHPEKVATEALRKVNLILAVGDRPDQTIRGFCKAVGDPIPRTPQDDKKKLHVVAWSRNQKKRENPFRLRISEGKAEHSRHRRKYAHGYSGYGAGGGLGLVGVRMLLPMIKKQAL